MRTGHRRLVIVLGVAAVVAVVGVGAIAAGLLWRFDQGVERHDIDLGDEETVESGGRDDRGAARADSEREQPDLPDPVDEVVTVLVAASDDRSVLTPEEQVEYGTGSEENGGRTEVNMLVRLDPDGPRADVLSLPRDSLVERCDGSRGRLNAAYRIGEQDGIGGPSCLMRTVRDWTGITPDHFVLVDFAGFVDLVDAVGGVEMWMGAPIVDERANLDVDEGCQRFDGGDALAFARARSIDNDFGRIARQQRLLLELRDEVVTAETATSPRRLLDLTDAAASALEVDSELSLRRMRQLAVAALDVPDEAIHTATLPGEIDDEPPYFTRVHPDDVTQYAEQFAEGALGEPRVEQARDTHEAARTPSGQTRADTVPDDPAGGDDGAGSEAGGGPEGEEDGDPYGQDAAEHDRGAAGSTSDAGGYVGTDRGPGC